MSMSKDAGHASTPSIESRWVGGQLVRIHVDGAAENGGVFDLLEICVRAGASGSPENDLGCADELLLVLSGHVEAWLDGRTVELGPGDTLTCVRGSSFGWRCAGPDNCRVMLRSRPSGAVRLQRLLGTSLGTPEAGNPVRGPAPQPRLKSALPLVARVSPSGSFR